MKKIIAFAFIALISFTGHSQNERPWKGKKCAVVITYDDAIIQHLDNAVPLLDSLGLKASFYITAYSPGCRLHLKEWRKVAAEGHELGNHTLYHPCVGDQPGREWVPSDYKLNNYTVRRIVEETRMTNAFLEALDGKTKRTFAFTCGDTKVHDTAFMDLMHDDFIAARSVRGQMHKIDEVNLYDVDCYVVNGESGAQLIEWAKKAMETNSLLVVLFHGVGGGNALNVSLPAHSQFLHYLKKNEKDIWIAPMIQVAEYVKDYQSRKK
jgi:peptidoglycan/xylan/chitin deacetylase (PgdA/CDA1 family)